MSILRNKFNQIACLLCGSAIFANAQTDTLKARVEKQVLEKTEKIKMSGYLQSQFQWGEENASLKIGAPNGDKTQSFSRIGIRRGRIKLAYEEKTVSAVVQMDLTEKSIDLKDAYISIKDPWSNLASLKTGVFSRPFGYEIGYSSSRRESPERSLVIQTLFPEERDLGASIVLHPSQSSPLNFFTLEAGLFAGNGIKQETDSRKDFIGHLSASKNLNRQVEVSLGASYYNGGVYQGSENVYTVKNKTFILNKDASNKGKFAKREYIGFDACVNLKSILGRTQITGEYLFGTQPGTNISSKSPNSSTLPTTDAYIRNFAGGYVMLVQNIGKSPLAAVVKYDFYDPNMELKGDEIGINGSGRGDIMYRTTGLGMLWNFTDALRLQAYYEFVKNEKTKNLADCSADIKDDIFTLRLQYKF